MTDNSWNDPQLRQKTTDEIDVIIKATGLQAKITAEKLESGIFSKSDTKEKYMINVEKVLIHLRKRKVTPQEKDEKAQKDSIDTNNEEKKDETEKSNQKESSETEANLSDTASESNPEIMEGALKRLSITENVKVKSEQNRDSPIIQKNDEVVIVSPPPPTNKPSEIKISQIYENVREMPRSSPPVKPSELRISQVHGSFGSNVILINPQQVRPRNPTPMLYEMRNISPIPRISNVTSLHRPPIIDNSLMRLQNMVHLPPPITNRPSLLEEATRFKYRESLIRRMLTAEEAVYNKAKNKEQYVNFFQNLFIEATNQVNASPEPQFKISGQTRANENLYQLLSNEPDRVKHFLTEEFKSIDFQIKSIIRNQLCSTDPSDIAYTDAKNILSNYPDEFEKGIGIFCEKMSTNYSISERNDIMRKD